MLPSRTLSRVAEPALEAATRLEAPATSSGPVHVTLHVWRVPRRHIPGALTRMGHHRGQLRHAAGVRFAKLLGTGDGRTFTVRDADLRHWALLVSWSGHEVAGAFARSPVARSWARIAEETLQVDLTPLAAKGSWAGRQPFGEPAPRSWDGPVAALTRARIRPSRAVTFWRSVPAVSADLHGSAGLRLALGIGEAPLGLQGTFSLWDSTAALRTFAYRQAPHVDAVRRTAEVGWYAEELFARFAVVGIDGTFRGRRP